VVLPYWVAKFKSRKNTESDIEHHKNPLIILITCSIIDSLFVS
jgi:hypothetical protein